MGVKTRSAAGLGSLLAAACIAAAPASAGDDGNYIPWPSVLPGIAVGPSGPPQAVPHCRSLRMRCVDRLVRRLRAEYRAHDAACDHRVIFSLGYLRITEEIRRRLEAGETFRHRRWFIGVVQGFSNLYFQTQRRYDRGKDVPESWRIYYDAMDSGDFNAGQDLLLASNAHTNHDLPYAYAASGLLTRRSVSRKPDHDGVNFVNASLFEGLADTYERRYDPFFATTNMLHPLDGMGSLQGIQLWRENAWRKAEALVAADTDSERQLVQQQIEAESAAWARLITSGAEPGHREVRDAWCEQH
jgi:hypothetical protein